MNLWQTNFIVLFQERLRFNQESVTCYSKFVAEQAELYQTKLRDRLQELRNELEDKLINTNEKLKISMQRQLDSVSNCANLFADKVNESQEKLSRLSENTAILRGQIAEFEVTLANSLQARKEAERRCQKAEASADSWRLECELLSSRIDEGARAYADLAGVKVQLDEEIAMYRVLLQSEEERCNLNITEHKKHAIASNRSHTEYSSYKRSEDNSTLDFVSKSGRGRLQALALFRRKRLRVDMDASCSSSASSLSDYPNAKRRSRRKPAATTEQIDLDEKTKVVSPSSSTFPDTK